MDSDDERLRAAYSRQLLKQDDRTLIESKCSYCGVRIVGSAMESLAEDELQHFVKCPGNKTKAART